MEREIQGLKYEYVDLVRTVLREGFLDDKYLELRQENFADGPYLVYEFEQSLFFSDAEKLINNLETALIGAIKVKNACCDLIPSCNQQNLEGCLTCLQNVKREYYLVKSKLEAIFKLEEEISFSDGVVPKLV